MSAAAAIKNECPRQTDETTEERRKWEMGNEMVIVFNKHRLYQGLAVARPTCCRGTALRSEVDIVVVVGCGCRNFEKLKLGR